MSNLKTVLKESFRNGDISSNEIHACYAACLAISEASDDFKKEFTTSYGTIAYDGILAIVESLKKK